MHNVYAYIHIIFQRLLGFGNVPMETVIDASVRQQILRSPLYCVFYHLLNILGHSLSRIFVSRQSHVGADFAAEHQRQVSSSSTHTSILLHTRLLTLLSILYLPSRTNGSNPTQASQISSTSHSLEWFWRGVVCPI